MKALVLCGGMPQLYLIQELQRRSIVALLADMNEKAPAVPYADKFFPISTLDYDGIYEIAKREHVDCILSVCADQMLLVAAKVSAALGLPCYLNYEMAKNVSNKALMKQIFVENGIPTAKHIIREVITPEDIEKMSFPLVTKPVDAYSSRGVKRVENYNELVSAFDEAVRISRTHTAVVEEYMDGDELSVDLYVENGIAKVLCIRALDKIPENNGFIICRGRYPAPVTDSAYQEVVCVGQQIADAFNLVDTPMLIQMKVKGDEVKVIEFCARTGGGIKYRLLPIVSQFDVVSAVLDLTLGKKPHYDGYQLDRYIVDEFLYCEPGELDHLEGFGELLREGVIDHYDQFKPRGHSFQNVTSSGDRVAYFSVSGDTFEQLQEKYQIAADCVKAVSTDGRDLIRHEIMQLTDY